MPITCVFVFLAMLGVLLLVPALAVGVILLASRQKKHALVVLGIPVGMIRPITLWPFPTQVYRDLAKRVKKFLVVEMSLGQFVEDVQIALNGRSDIYLHKRPGGSIPTGEEVLDIARKILSGDESKLYLRP